MCEPVGIVGHVKGEGEGVDGHASRWHESTVGLLPW